METITEIEVTIIETHSLGCYYNGATQHQVTTNTFIFDSRANARKFASKVVHRNATVVVTDVTNGRDKILFNSAWFKSISGAKKFLKAL